MPIPAAVLGIKALLGKTSASAVAGTVATHGTLAAQVASSTGQAVLLRDRRGRVIASFGNQAAARRHQKNPTWFVGRRVIALLRGRTRETFAFGWALRVFDRGRMLMVELIEPVRGVDVGGIVYVRVTDVVDAEIRSGARRASGRNGVGRRRGAP